MISSVVPHPEGEQLDSGEARIPKRSNSTLSQDCSSAHPCQAEEAFFLLKKTKEFVCTFGTFSAPGISAGVLIQEDRLPKPLL